MVGPECDDLLIFNDGQFILTLRTVEVGEVIAGSGVVRVELGYGLEFLSSIVEVTLNVIDDTEVVMRINEVRIYSTLILNVLGYIFLVQNKIRLPG